MPIIYFPDIAIHVFFFFSFFFRKLMLEGIEVYVSDRKGELYAMDYFFGLLQVQEANQKNLGFKAVA